MLTNEEAAAGCGFGCGPGTCAYLAMGSAGFLCGRAMPSMVAHIERRLAQGSMNAQVAPQNRYPECQRERAVLALQVLAS